MLRSRLLIAVVWIVALSAPTGLARSLSVGFGLDAPASRTASAPTVRARATLFDLRVGDDAFDVGVARLDGAVGAAASWRRTVVAGPVGTLVVDGRAGVDADGVGFAAGVRGTVGPVALRVAIEAGTRAPAPFGVLERAPATAAPLADGARLTGALAGTWRYDLALGAVWRPDRSWTWELAPRLHADAAGWSGGAALSLRRAGVATEVDLSGRIDLATGPLGGHLAAGVTLHHVPRRAPESRATLWWGGGRGAAGPGIDVAWVVRDAGAQLTVAGGWGPAWSDRPASYAALALLAPLPRGTAQAGLAWRADGRVVVEVGWSAPLDR